MIFIMKTEVSPDQIKSVVAWVEDQGCEVLLSQGEERTIIGVVGDDRPLSRDQAQLLEGVERTVDILAPYKLASLDMQPEPTLVPLNVLRRSWEAAQIARRIAESGNKNSVSDAGVAALTARCAAEGAYLNVCINLPGIEDDKFKADTLKEAEDLRSKVVGHTEKTVRLAEKTISEM